LQQTIRHGRQGQMPAQNELLGNDKVQLLAAYVYSLSHGLNTSDCRRQQAISAHLCRIVLGAASTLATHCRTHPPSPFESSDSGLRLLDADWPCFQVDLERCVRQIA
jgi:hypothetical protein